MRDQERDVPRPDPRLAAALREAEGDPPVDQVDWEALRGSIRARAELPLARRRVPRATARPARRWARPLVPLAVAASAALAVWLGLPDAAEPPGGVVAEWEVSAEEALQADVSEQEFRALVTGRANAEQLLLLAVGEG